MRRVTTPDKQVAPYMGVSATGELVCVCEGVNVTSVVKMDLAHLPFSSSTNCVC